MKRFKRVLVCIDRPERDAHMIVYAGGRSRVAESREVHFLHVAGEPAAGVADSAATTQDSPPITQDTLQALVNEHFDGHGGEKLICQVISGSPLVETLRYAHDKDIDLIMMSRYLGQSPGVDDVALLARRVTRKSTCSVLVLPEQYQQQARAIVVPVRDSDCSATALEVACDVAKTTGAKVTALNVYHVGAGYSRVGTTLERHQELLQAAAERECERLLERSDTHGVKVECVCKPELGGNPVPIILQELGSGAGKAVVIGARGRSGAAGVLLGNVTEQLIQQCPSPLLAVKKKGECLGVLQALLTIAGQS